MEKIPSDSRAHGNQVILDASLDAILIFAADGCILNANLAAVRCYGYSIEELRQLNVAELVVPEARDVAQSRLGGLAVAGTMFESQHTRRDGSSLNVEIHTQPMVMLGKQVIFAIVRDISERKQTEAWWARRSQLLEMIVAGAELPLILDTLVRAIEDQSPGMIGSILLLDDDGVHVLHGAAPHLPEVFIAAVNGSPIGPRAGSCGTAAYRREAVYVEDLRSDPLWDDYRALATESGLVAAWSQPIMDGSGRVLGTFAMYYTYAAMPGAAHLELMEAATHIGSIAISHHRAQVALEEKDARLVMAQKVACLGFFEWNLKTDAMYCSDEAYRLWGLECEAGFDSSDIIANVVHPEDLARVQGALNRVTLGHGEYDIVHRIVHADGRVIWVQAQAEMRHDPRTDADVLLGTMFDISKRVAAEAALERMTRLYAALSQCNQAIVRCANSEELFDQICRDAVEFGGMSSAWISMLDLSRDALTTVAAFGAGAEELRSLSIRVRGEALERPGPVVVSMQESRPYWCQDFQADPLTLTWRENAADMGWKAVASLPLHQEGEVVGVLVVHSDICGAFDEWAKRLLIEMATDISFALDRFNSEADRKLSNEKLRASELHLRTIIETEPECVKVVGQGGELLEMNAAGLAMFEVDSIENVRGRSLSTFLLPEHRQHFNDLHKRVMRGESGMLEFEIIGRNGTRRWLETHAAPMRDADGQAISLLGISRDVTERRRSEERIHYLANYDALTGLPNRNLLADHLQYAISLAKRSNGQLAVIFIDLDRFKEINDTLGHSVGDAFLIEVGKRLKAVLRESDTLSRLGGDEFILVLPDTDAQGAANIVDSLLEAVAQPYQVEHYALIVTASIGIAIYPNDGEDPETLLRSADTAMYRAKEDGRSGYRYFTAEMQVAATRHMQLVNAMRRALEENQFHLHFQPQFSLENDQIIGVEALLRWQHPELGAISPMEFIPVSEDCGLILPIGEWVIRTAVHQLKQWLERGYPPMIMAVNLSAVQFRHRSLPSLVTNILADAGLPADLLELELTESVAMHDPKGAIAVMDNLHDRGIRMSIDDFGTGYSSLNYLKKFRVYKLKIDQSFIRDISTDSEDRAIVAAIISMSRSLGLKTIAEGVETVEQLAFLREQGCDEAQGYYFSKPLPIAKMDALLAARLANGMDT